jgi:hypothetical protein
VELEKKEGWNPWDEMEGETDCAADVGAEAREKAL